MSELNCTIAFNPYIPKSPRARNLVGQIFGRLTVFSIYAQHPRLQRVYWLCRCVCGQWIIKLSERLRCGECRSCGCLNRDLASQRTLLHGETKKGKRSAEYRIYIKAKSRCRNTNLPEYARYGARGIEFRFASFTEFLNEVGRRPTAEYSIDRINNNGHYEKGNVRWATKIEQARNKRNNTVLTAFGKSQTLVEWAEELNCHTSTLCSRLYLSRWCVTCSVSIAPRSGRRCTHIV